MSIIVWPCSMNKADEQMHTPYHYCSLSTRDLRSLLFNKIRQFTQYAWFCQWFNVHIRCGSLVLLIFYHILIMNIRAQGHTSDTVHYKAKKVSSSSNAHLHSHMYKKTKNSTHTNTAFSPVEEGKSSSVLSSGWSVYWRATRFRVKGFVWKQLSKKKM